MPLLAIDTSTAKGSLALFSDEGQLLEETTWFRPKGHSEVLTPSLEALLKSQSMVTSDLDQLALDVGPGSFTGIRVGLNLARALAYSHDIPVIGIPSLRVLAQPGLDEGRTTLTLVNAFRNSLYVALYSPSETLIPPCALGLEGLEKQLQGEDGLLTLGDGLSVYEPQMTANFKARLQRKKSFSDYPHASYLGRLALSDQFQSQKNPWISVKPLYIRASEAEEKMSRGLLKPLPKI